MARKVLVFSSCQRKRIFVWIGNAKESCTQIFEEQEKNRFFKLKIVSEIDIILYFDLYE